MEPFMRECFKGKTSKRAIKRLGHRGKSCYPTVIETGIEVDQYGRMKSVAQVSSCYEERNYKPVTTKTIKTTIPLDCPYSVIARLESFAKNGKDNAVYVRLDVPYTVTTRTVITQVVKSKVDSLSAIDGVEAGNLRHEFKRDIRARLLECELRNLEKEGESQPVKTPGVPIGKIGVLIDRQYKELRKERLALHLANEERNREKLAAKERRKQLRATEL